MFCKFWLVILLLLFLFGCSSIPKDGPQDHYVNYIKTRIIIEYIPTEGGNKLPAITLDKAYENLKFTADFYHDLNIDFLITSVEYVEFDEKRTATKCIFEDGLKNRDELPIYFLIIKSTQEKVNVVSVAAAMGSLPNVNANGIALYYWGCNKWALPHEFGHWSNLLHTFDHENPNGDFVDDTEDTDDVCYGDIMNYSISDERFVTPGQIVRMKYCLEHFRQNTIVRIPR